MVGCPAEELGSASAGSSRPASSPACDVALMAHASDMRRAHRLFLGNRKFELVFHGRAAHAAAYPERGINALDGVIALFVAIGLLRQQLPRGARIHGIVSEGGKAPNVIPERAAARVWVRALDDAVLERRGVAPARAAPRAPRTATGTRLEVIRGRERVAAAAPEPRARGRLPPPARAARAAGERPRPG